jgi:hypothetical protein
MQYQDNCEETIRRMETDKNNSGVDLPSHNAKKTMNRREEKQSKNERKIADEVSSSRAYNSRK